MLKRLTIPAFVAALFALNLALPTATEEECENCHSCSGKHCCLPVSEEEWGSNCDILTSGNCIEYGEFCPGQQNR